MIASPPKKKLAVWTPELSEDNGQNIITRRVIDIQSPLFGKVYKYPSGSWTTIPQAMWQATQLFMSLVFRRHCGVYLVCSRSTAGFFRDALPLITSRLGARVVVHVHGSDFPDLLNRRGIGGLARWLYARCEVIVPSQHLIAPLTKYKFHQLTVCDNFASTTKGSNFNRPEQPTETLVVLWNSNVMSSKGIIELTQGLQYLRQEGHPVKLIVLGKAIGDNERSAKEMTDFLHGLNYYEWIDVKGPVPAEEVPRLIMACDVVALPSTYSCECQPLAVIQGMLSERTILVSDTEAMRATVGDYPAIFCSREPEAIATSLRPLIAQRQKRNVLLKASKRAHNRFSQATFDARIQYALSGS